MENERLENLFTAARNAREAANAETALKFYEEISAIDPNSWEALFYVPVLKAKNITYGEISNAAVDVTNCLSKVFEMIDTTIEDDKEKRAAAKEVVNQCGETAAWLIRASGQFYNSVTNQGSVSFGIFSAAMNMDTKRNAKYESAQRMLSIAKVLTRCGKCIESTFDVNDEFYKKLAAECWEVALAINFEHIKTYEVAVYDEEKLQKIVARFRKYNPSYVVPDIKPTERRNYTIKGIIMVLIALGIGVLITLPFWNLYF